MDFGQAEVIYRAEGNANLVLALPQYKKVLRLPKTSIISKKSDNAGPSDAGGGPNKPNKSKSDTSSQIHTEQSGGQDVPSLEDYATYMRLMRHFVGSSYISEPEIVCISSSTDRQRIQNLCEPFRPADRRDKNFCGQFGLLLPDATLLPDSLLADLQPLAKDTFAIEIKPKQGWLLQDSIASIHNLFHFGSSTRCRYCAMQYSKFQSCKITQLSGYCPMNLFSGNRSRMKDALNALYRCPQNNLRVFQNGNLIFGNHSRSIQFDELKDLILKSDLDISDVSDVVVDCLLTNYCDKLHSGLNGTKANPNIPENCALWTILQLQLLAQTNLEIMSTTKMQTNKTYSTLRSLLMKTTEPQISDLSAEEQYLLAATMMDCSVLIAFRETKFDQISSGSGSPNIVCVGNRNFVTQVTIVDLDPKPDNHFWKFVEVTNKAYSDLSEFEKRRN